MHRWPACLYVSRALQGMLEDTTVIKANKNHRNYQQKKKIFRRKRDNPPIAYVGNRDPTNDPQQYAAMVQESCRPILLPKIFRCKKKNCWEKIVKKHS